MKASRTSIRSLIKQAYKNRYDYDVTLNKDGDITGYLEGSKDGHKLGNIEEYSTSRNECMNVRLKRGNALIFTFAYDK